MKTATTRLLSKNLAVLDLFLNCHFQHQPHTFSLHGIVHEWLANYLFGSLHFCIRPLQDSYWTLVFFWPSPKSQDSQLTAARKSGYWHFINLRTYLWWATLLSSFSLFSLFGFVQFYWWLQLLLEQLYLLVCLSQACNDDSYSHPLVDGFKMCKAVSLLHTNPPPPRGGVGLKV